MDWFFQSLHFDDELLNNDIINPGDSAILSSA
jgi:hypothetical protein